MPVNLPYQQVQLISNILDDETMSIQVLRSIGLEVTSGFSEYDTPLAFWQNILPQISNRIDDILTATARLYPYNEELSHWQTVQTFTDNVPTDSGISIVITGYRGDINNLHQQINQLAQQQPNFTHQSERLYATNNTIAFYFNPATENQIDALITTLNKQLNQGTGQRVSIARVSFPDYILRRIFAEGPDQQRFELNNVPASTPINDLARATMSQYHEDMWPRDTNGVPRQATADHITEDGTSHRLNPGSTLHENGIREDGTVQINPESTAGSINPMLRDEALVRVRLQILEYKKTFPEFDVKMNAVDLPSEYLFSFPAPSYAPPEPGASPPRINHHEVRLLLPPNFPMQAPIAQWLTPIFHPNIHSTKGVVCLGELRENYRPAMDFAKLCQMLVEIASFQNYAWEEGFLNREAALWAASEAGQKAIADIGGRTLERKADLINSMDGKPQLRIKRCSV